MTQGRHTSILVILSADEQGELRQWLRSTTISAGRAKRARLILLIASGATITASARRAGLSRHHASKWLVRFQTHRLAGLYDRHRRPTLRRPMKEQKLPCSENSSRPA